MCIRDSPRHAHLRRASSADDLFELDGGIGRAGRDVRLVARGGGDPCLLYTSDAADERSSVDLGGRRIIKKKKKKEKK